jgi:hypothetical protein
MATSPTTERPVTQDATSPAKSTGEKPAATIRYGKISAVVYTTPVKLPNGKTVTSANVSWRKSYRSAAGEWEHTHTLGAEDVLPAAFVLTRCAEFIASLRNSDQE